MIPRQQSELIQNQVFNPDKSESIRPRINPNRIFHRNQSEWIQGRNDSEWFGLIRIVLSELIGLGRIDFWPFFIKRDTKHFSDWFGMIRNGSDTDIGMSRNSAGWLGINFNPILSPGWMVINAIQMTTLANIKCIIYMLNNKVYRFYKFI